MLKGMVEKGKYIDHLLTDYDSFEYEKLNTIVDHSRDFNLAYVATKQLEGKYLSKDKINKRTLETPQFLYILVAMCLFRDYPKKERMGYIEKYYNAISLHKISLPTPVMAGVRTPVKQFSSCVLIESDDTLDSINASASGIIKYISKKAGIGINGGRIRAVGSSIGDGSTIHTGVIPFWKHFQTAVKSCSQGGVRGGSATLFYPMWHYEFEDLIVLKNNRGVEENRIRQLDYAVQINKLMYQRLLKGGNITLFSPHEVEGLYGAFFQDQDLFEKLYVEAENNPNIRKKTIKAVDAFSVFLQERASTGRIYVQNVDHCNTNSPFDSEVAPIRQSNLCLEILLPTKPLKSVEDVDGEVALCTLSAFNLGSLNSSR